MNSVRFTADTSSHGVRERGFTLGEIPGVLWTPASGSAGAPLILLGHGGGLHKRARGLVDRARYYVTTCGFTAAAIDAPGHGDRPRPPRDEQRVAALRQARAAGEPLAPIVAEFNAALAERAVPEWRAALDALQALPGIGRDAPIGYSGMTLATAIGLPLMATDARITAAVLGGAFAYPDLTEAARRVTAPVTFLLPWDDTEIDRESGFALFDALAATDKTLYATPGGHHEVPWHATENSAGFFQRHLGPITPAPA